MGKPAMPWPSGIFYSSWDTASKRVTGKRARDCSRALVAMSAGNFGLVIRESLSEKGHWVESRRASDLRERFPAVGTAGAQS